MMSTVTTTMMPALQCCLLCRRTITDREQHLSFRDCVMAMLRVEYPDWASQTASRCDSSVASHRPLPERRTERPERSHRLRAIQIRRRRAQRVKSLRSVRTPHIAPRVSDEMLAQRAQIISAMPC